MAMISGPGGSRDTGNVLAARLVVDMEDMAYEIDKEVAKLLTITTTLKQVETATQPRYDWREFSPLSREAAVEGTATTTATTVNVEAGQGARFLADDLVINTSTGEVFSVTSIATDALTVVRAWGGDLVNGTAMADADPLVILGQTKPEGSSLPNVRSEEETSAFNYTEICRVPVDLTRTLMKTNLYGGDERQLQRRRGLNDIKKDVERKFLFGKKQLVAGGASTHPRRSTQGFFSFVSANPAASKPTWLAVSYNNFVSLAQEVMRYPNAGDGKTKLFLAGPVLMAAVQNAWEGQIRLDPMETAYGLKVQRIVTEFGVFDLDVHWIMADAFFAKRAAVIDTKLIKRRPLTDGDIKLAVDVHLPGYDGIKDEYITEQGFQLMIPKAHGDVTYTGS